jgi:hypothetical protein
MRVIFAGGANWNDPYLIDNVLVGLQRRFGTIEVVHGGGAGANHMVDCLAKRYALDIEVFEPVSFRDKVSINARTTRMVAAGADLAVVFQGFVTHKTSGHAGHVVHQCADAGIPIMAFPDCMTITRAGTRYERKYERSLVELRDGPPAQHAPALTG